jgi:hypothetical protein
MSQSINNKFHESTIFNCQTICLSTIQLFGGSNVRLVSGVDLPFQIERVYFLYGVPTGESRGGHAHKLLHQYLIAVTGGFDVVLFDGMKKKTVRLDNPRIALHIVPGIWRELENFTSGSICVVLASQTYQPTDYIRDINTFKHSKNVKNPSFSRSTKL